MTNTENLLLSSVLFLWCWAKKREHKVGYRSRITEWQVLQRRNAVLYFPHRDCCARRVFSHRCGTSQQCPGQLTTWQVRGGGKQLTQVNKQLNQDQFLQKTASWVLFIVQFVEVRSKLMHWFTLKILYWIRDFSGRKFSTFLEYFDTSFCSP